MPDAWRLLWCCLLSLSATNLCAQEYSYDGNRWYDVEVSIFTNEVPGGTRSEVPVARKLTAAYLPRLRELQSPSTSFLIDFPGEGPELLSPAPGSQVALAAMGPAYSPAAADAFRIADFARDPFIDLDARMAQFGAMNRSINAAPEHRLLWHKIWRQPLQGRAQTPAIFISGGALYAEHSELEGSLRLVDNAGGAMLDINIWLNEFMPPAASEALEEWKIPPLPFPPADLAAPNTMPWKLTAVWQLAQTRELGANQLYYLDHPALGVLIQVRPYVLPPQPVDASQEDF